MLPDQRQQIHDLVQSMHLSGLSPPEEAILNKLEAKEHDDISDWSNS